MPLPPRRRSACVNSGTSNCAGRRNSSTSSRVALVVVLAVLKTDGWSERDAAVHGLRIMDAEAMTVRVRNRIYERVDQMPPCGHQLRVFAAAGIDCERFTAGHAGD